LAQAFKTYEAIRIIEGLRASVRRQGATHRVDMEFTGPMA
jgi:hypothetical protein